MSNSFGTPWTVAFQASLSVGSPRQEYWTGVPFPSLGALPNPGIKPAASALTGIFFTTEPPGKPFCHLLFAKNRVASSQIPLWSTSGSQWLISPLWSLVPMSIHCFEECVYILICICVSWDTVFRRDFLPDPKSGQYMWSASVIRNVTYGCKITVLYKNLINGWSDLEPWIPEFTYVIFKAMSFIYSVMP